VVGRNSAFLPSPVVLNMTFAVLEKNPKPIISDL